MRYKFVISYNATDSHSADTRFCYPSYGDDLSISIDRAEGEWYYTRNLDGKLVFERDDYAWIMSRNFDGTFTLFVRESHDNGVNWYDYFTGTFSRASMEIDEDNRTATLNGLKEGVEDPIKNGRKEDYDLMKLIPDSDAKEVQGQVHPALVLIDDRSDRVKQSDMYCGTPIKAGGYNYSEYPNITSLWGMYNDMHTSVPWLFMGVYAEAKVTMTNRSSTLNGLFAAQPTYGNHTVTNYTLLSVYGDLTSQGSTNILRINTYKRPDSIYAGIYLHDANMNVLGYEVKQVGDNQHSVYSPNSLVFSNITPGEGVNETFEKIEIIFHYIYAALLTSIKYIGTNYMDTGDYYKGIELFNNSDGGLVTTITSNTSEQPNGHRMVPGSDDYSGIPQYFAPPDNNPGWIPLAEENWNYASMWYRITPSVANGLLAPAKYGSFRWTRCWPIGTCIRHLLDRITNGKVVFSETADYSQFLYGNPNPVQGHEPFQWLVTQKSNVMRPAAGGASRCTARLDWFLELLRNAFNCYYWFERRNDGRYNFRIEHVEYFRRGGAYNGQLADQLDLTRLKPVRNFLRNGVAAKRYADQTNRYTFDLDGMVEKYTYSWQGDGGSDDFRGNPMYFKAGWIEKGTSEDRQVDNIFADLGWLLLNSGTETESSKNYDGLFIFGGYQPYNTELWSENAHAPNQYITLAYADVWLTIPLGRIVTVEVYNTESHTAITHESFTGTSHPQQIAVGSTGSRTLIYRLNLTTDYSDIIINRIHARSGNTYYVPNVVNLLRSAGDNILQNGVLAWPWLQKEYLHFDIPAANWTYLRDEYTVNQETRWEYDGTIKMVKKQTVGVVPIPDASTERDIIGIMAIKTGLGIGIVDSAKINLSSRNAEMIIIYDINTQNQ